MVIVVDAVGQFVPPTVYEIVYTPGVLVDKLIAPVDEFRDNPDDEEYAPPVLPLNVTDAVPLGQNTPDP